MVRASERERERERKTGTHRTCRDVTLPPLRTNLFVKHGNIFTLSKEHPPKHYQHPFYV